MKSFFKKVALVLALAMVVTMMPAKAVSAADAPQMRKTMKLYIDGDFTEKYSDTAYAWVKYDSTAYSVAFASDNEAVATVGAKKGGVTAVSVGSANVTATFTNKETGKVAATLTCEVTVKRNAVDAGISDASAAKIQELTVGDKVLLKTYRQTSDDEKTWKGKKVITDSARFESSDKEIFTVSKTGGTITAVAPGEATLKVWAVQFEGAKKDADGNVEEYQATTIVQEYPVKVVAANITAEQSAYNAFHITFPSGDEAKTAVEKTQPSLNTSNAAVTEAKDIIKVYRVIKGNNKEKIGEVAVFISGVSQTADNKVFVELFDELDQEADYIIRYQDQEVSVTTIKNVARKLTISSWGEKLYDDSNETKQHLVYNLFAIGPNGQDVNISGCKDYGSGDWRASVELTDLQVDKYHADENYMLDRGDRANEPVIWFHTSNPQYAVQLQAAYDDWVNPEADGRARTLTSEVTRITPGDVREVPEGIIDWGIDNYGKKIFAANDTGRKLIVKATVYDNYYKKSIEKESVNDTLVEDHFTFVSTNDDKLVIDKTTGELYPPKQPMNTVVRVLVYYDEQYIGYCDVEVVKEREFSGFTASLASKLNYNSDKTKDINDTLRLTLYPVDQLGDVYTKNIDYDIQILGSDMLKGYLDFQQTIPDGWADDNPYFNISVNENAFPALPKDKVTNFRFVCVATCTDEKGEKVKELKYSVSLSAKDTKGAEVKSYDLETSSNSVDMYIGSPWFNGTPRTNVTDKVVTFKAYSYDKDGFKIEHIDISNAAVDNANSLRTTNGAVSFAIQLGKDYIDASKLVANGRDLKFATVTSENREIVQCSASGAAEIVTKKLLHKEEEGSYAAYFYVGSNSRAVLKSSEIVKVTDSQELIAWTWDKYTTDSNISTKEDENWYISQIEQVIHDAIKFNRYWYNWEWHYDYDDHDNHDGHKDYHIYIGYVVEENGMSVPAFDKDIVINGDRLTIRQVRCLITLRDADDEYLYEMVIPVMRTVRFGVTD